MFRYVYERVWKVGQVAKLLNRRTRSIYRYESTGITEKGKQYPTAAGREVRFYTKQDLLELHEAIAEIHQGRPRRDSSVRNNTLPSRAELIMTLRERYGV